MGLAVGTQARDSGSRVRYLASPGPMLSVWQRLILHVKQGGTRGL